MRSRAVVAALVVLISVVALAPIGGEAVPRSSAPLNTNAVSDSGGDFAAQMTTDGAGNWVAVWDSTEANVGGGIGDDHDILVSRSTDSGATWTAPAPLNTNAEASGLTL